MDQSIPFGSLSKDRLQRLLGGEERPRLFVFDELDSTNQYAKELAKEGDCSPALVVANAQSAGRGRMGRQFYSPAGSGAYFSLLYPIEGEVGEVLSITSAAAVAVMRAIRSLCGKQAEIKWVNDLYLNGKKICGILAQTLLSTDGGTSFLVLGIGINWHPAVFPAELSSIAGTVGVTEPLREELIAAVYWELLPFLENREDRSWLSEYRAHSMVLGKRIAWMQGETKHYGVAWDVDEAGGLSVLTDEGDTVVLRTGEISIRLE